MEKSVSRVSIFQGQFLQTFISTFVSSTVSPPPRPGIIQLLNEIFNFQGQAFSISFNRILYHTNFNFHHLLAGRLDREDDATKDSIFGDNFALGSSSFSPATLGPSHTCSVVGTLPFGQNTLPHRQLGEQSFGYFMGQHLDLKLGWETKITQT